MGLHTVERGTLWVREHSSGPPNELQPRVDASFGELGQADLEELAAAMRLPTEPVRSRIEAGRRCFCLCVDGAIAAYGWVTQGKETVGELERQFLFQQDEAYIWDCATLTEWRRQRFYTALLNQITRQLLGEGVRRVWIGASRLNQPSVRAFATAGFGRVLDLTYRRFYRFSLMRISPSGKPLHPLFGEAQDILINSHEARLGPLVVGFR